MLQNAIANAKTLEEVERLNRLLQAGQIPGRENGHTGKYMCTLIYFIYFPYKNIKFTFVTKTHILSTSTGSKNIHMFTSSNT